MPFGIGIWEAIVLVLLLALLFGPARLPRVARTLGRSVREVRAPLDEIRRSVSPTALLEESEERQRRPEQRERDDTTRGTTG
jgi:TatA/E family protein of Tat protein translocase